MRKRSILGDKDKSGVTLINSSTTIYRLWRSMRHRCNNTNDVAYSYYGERGIKVCNLWENSFIKFYEYVSKLPNFSKYKTSNYSIDRIDNSKGYEPKNIRWVSKTTQVINRKNYNKDTGYTGIRYNPKCPNKPYSGRVYFERKETVTGYSTSLKEALKQRNEYIIKNKLPHKIQTFTS